MPALRALALLARQNAVGDSGDTAIGWPFRSEPTPRVTAQIDATTSPPELGTVDARPCVEFLSLGGVPY